jgi:hypothetical protein
LIPSGWRLVTDGPALAGDKYWNAAEGAWYPVTVNTFKDAEDYVAVIRKEER